MSTVKPMTIAEVRTAIEQDPDKIVFLRTIAALTPEQTHRLTSLLEFGWARIRAGEDVDAAVAEWKEAQQ